MINILIPLAGGANFFDSDEYPYPKPLIEILGRMMIEMVIANFQSLKVPHHFIFVINQRDVLKFHLDDTLNLLTDGNCHVVQLKGDTRGAACSALMAVDYIDNNERLIIANGDQFLDMDIENVISTFDEEESDGGVVTFNSVHPKWSYVRLNDKHEIIETAEKRPISNNAVAGFYYFRKGSDFVTSAMNSIEKDASVNGLYFVAPVMNEMVLQQKKLTIFKIDNNRYHSFYSPQKIKEYEMLCSGGRQYETR